MGAMAQWRMRSEIECEEGRAYVDSGRGHCVDWVAVEGIEQRAALGADSRLGKMQRGVERGWAGAQCTTKEYCSCR